MPFNLLTYRFGANEENTFARSKPIYVNAAKLLAGVEKTMAVPPGANFCIFSGDADFYVRADAHAAVPSADILDGSAPEMNPAQWDVHDVSQLHLVSPEDMTLTLSFYE